MNPLRTYLSLMLPNKTPLTIIKNWGKSKQLPVTSTVPDQWFHIKYLALHKLVVASRILVAENPDDPQLNAIKEALKYYEDYWVESTNPRTKKSP